MSSSWSHKDVVDWDCDEPDEITNASHEEYAYQGGCCYFLVLSPVRLRTATPESNRVPREVLDYLQNIPDVLFHHLAKNLHSVVLTKDLDNRALRNDRKGRPPLMFISFEQLIPDNSDKIDVQVHNTIFTEF
ncbi:hypothetical protein AVEN_25896-1 [Araneus ventricosus]|uniref:Uncharacterized protein n=1 Tax=Araneus ventricosus TaxID=182803 RepID=A0A4Y2FBE5_ARAVE|nr:hypothetical protein AVEN_25896-1 [Araneus ventricosus]